MIYVDWIVKKEKSIGTWDVFLMLWTLWGLGCDTFRRLSQQMKDLQELYSERVRDFLHT